MNHFRTKPPLDLNAVPPVWGEPSGALETLVKREALFHTILGGFLLMIVLVSAAAYFGYQQSQSIQVSARALVREHLVDTSRGEALEASIEQQSRQLLDNLVWLMGACLVLAVAGAGATIFATDRMFRRLQRQSDELQRVSWHLVEGHETISRHFSHEMHDELGQALAGLKSMLTRSPDPHRGQLLEVLDEVIRDMRELSQILRPVILDDFGLDPALRWLTDRFGQRTGIEVAYQSNVHQRLESAAETHLFRVAQEALTNIARHSGATKASVTLDAKGATLILIIEDEGRGISHKDVLPKSSLGMVGMRARMRQVNGSLTVENRRHGGLRVCAEAPLL